MDMDFNRICNLIVQLEPRRIRKMNPKSGLIIIDFLRVIAVQVL
jgi:hypothetical protein